MTDPTRPSPTAAGATPEPLPPVAPGRAPLLAEGAPATPLSAQEAAALTLDNRRIERRARAMLWLMALLLGLVVLYLLYARGVFEQTQRLVLTADDSEGVVVGMDVTFAGFPIGRVRRIELGPEGNARILVDVAKRDAHWLRTSSVFTLSKGLVGAPAIRAFTGLPTDPPLPEGAERKVLAGDAASEIPKMVNAARDLLNNLNALTSSESALSTTLSRLQSVSSKLDGPRGAVGVLMGNDTDAQRIVTALERSNALLSRLDELTRNFDATVGRVGNSTHTLLNRVDGVVVKADQQLLGPKGVVADSQASVQQLQALLTDARQTVKGVDKLLVELQAVAGNAKVATADLGGLRAEVDASLRKVEQLINEVNRRWPLARETQIKLP